MRFGCEFWITGSKVIQWIWAAAVSVDLPNLPSNTYLPRFGSWITLRCKREAVSKESHSLDEELIQVGELTYKTNLILVNLTIKLIQERNQSKDVPSNFVITSLGNFTLTLFSFTILSLLSYSVDFICNLISWMFNSSFILWTFLPE